MKSFTCPYCYGKHDVATSPIECSYSKKGDKSFCPHGLEKDKTGLVTDKNRIKCMKCTSARKVVKCDVTNDEIPSDYIGVESLSIALLGAKAVGKSNYIGVLINEIKKKMTSSFNCAFNMCCNERSNRDYMNRYYKPLFEENDTVRATDKGETKPMIFSLRFLDKKNHVSNVAALSFYDTAGENLNSVSDMVINNRYIPNADGIILLLDPLQIPSIREQLKGKMNLPPKNTDVTEVLSRVVQNIRDVKNVKGQIKTPLALAFTKIDALEKFDIIKEDSCLRDESAHLDRGVFVLSDFESVNLEMQDILESWLDAELIQLMKQFEKCAFFGVSSLGNIPKSDNTLSAKVAPRRVLDPLLWLLAENKYIKSVKR